MRWGTKEKKFRKGEGKRLSKRAGWNNEPQNARRIRLTTLHCWRDPFLNFFGRSAYFINALIKFSLSPPPLQDHLPSLETDLSITRVYFRQLFISYRYRSITRSFKMAARQERENWNWKEEEECWEASSDRAFCGHPISPWNSYGHDNDWKRGIPRPFHKI